MPEGVVKEMQKAHEHICGKDQRGAIAGAVGGGAVGGAIGGAAGGPAGAGLGAAGGAVAGAIGHNNVKIARLF
eukprot:CAMPEP_0115112946 /NCGR_PEP_ID=MMETSP0227-20121206/41008_1 /TAXON_ID=89957 /ORGANISM="Polarella glacialis, Strain CCMP 1383" /LENGTH=72 /DNA_ID=CAMNT_0002512741 /DNA_START=87 /DNA_END=302 /DNA_ORIENTATION=-